MTSVLVIMGPTASGKSRLAVEVAQRLNGEIVSADAFAVYRGMDIGTDKPSIEVRRNVPHHLLDILDPSEPFSAGAYVDAADNAIEKIVDRGRIPIVAGGTHFYIRSLLLGLFPAPPQDPEVRACLEREWEEDPRKVFRRLEALDPEAAALIRPTDRQRILRALEVRDVSGEPISTHWNRHTRVPRYDALLTAPNRPRDVLYARIDSRVDDMFAGGLVDEVTKILEFGTPTSAHSLKAIGYREVVAMLLGRIQFKDAIEGTKRSSRKLAKRQLTWLRREKEGQLNWVPPAGEGGTTEVCNLWAEFLDSAAKNGMSTLNHQPIANFEGDT